MGLGKVLMGEFERIGRSSGMDKGMLTCLKGTTIFDADFLCTAKRQAGNKPAVTFYAKNR